MKVLVVDDHPLTVEGYIYSISKHSHFSEGVDFIRARDCESAFLVIEKCLEEGDFFDLAIVDYGLPSYPMKDLENGASLVNYLKLYMPECKTLILTAHTEVLIVYDIIKNVRPHGLAIKNDITPENLPETLLFLLTGLPFLSPLARKCQAEILKKELMFDDNNRMILLYLSKGFKMIDLEHHIPLAAVTIKKRISKMRLAFEVPDLASLIQEAFKQGFV